MEQLSSCGLKTIKQQLTLKRLVHSFTSHVQTRPLKEVKEAKEEKGKAGRKLTRAEMKSLPPEEIRVYLMM